MTDRVCPRMGSLLSSCAATLRLPGIVFLQPLVELGGNGYIALFGMGEALDGITVFHGFRRQIGLDGFGPTSPSASSGLRRATGARLNLPRKLPHPS